MTVIGKEKEKYIPRRYMTVTGKEIQDISVGHK